MSPSGGYLLGVHEVHYTRPDERFASQNFDTLEEAQAFVRSLIAEGRQVLSVNEVEGEVDVRFTLAPPLRPSSLAERLAA
jgi:hypothetical protein